MDEKIQEVKRLKEIETNLKKLNPNYEGKVMQRVADALGISISHAKNLEVKSRENKTTEKYVKDDITKKLENQFYEKYGVKLTVNKTSVSIKLNENTCVLKLLKKLIEG